MLSLESSSMSEAIYFSSKFETINLQDSISTPHQDIIETHERNNRKWQPDALNRTPKDLINNDENQYLEVNDEYTKYKRRSWIGADNSSS